MPLVLMEAQQKISVIYKSVFSAARKKSLDNKSEDLTNKDVMIGKSHIRTAQETQEYWKSSPAGKALGISHLFN